jgi:imidazolonepropionase-like amidohydrolase
MPVRVLAYRSCDILNALELAEEFSFDLILEGTIEAHLVAEQIADANVPVVLGRMDHAGTRRNDVFRRAVLDQGAALSQVGASWIVGSGPTAGRARFLAQNAQLAAAHNRIRDPLKLITADAADVLKVTGHIGRLHPGMLADFVVWSGDPLDPASKVLRVYVGGALVYERVDETEEGNDE